MRRAALLLLLLVAPAAALSETGDPLRTTSDVPVGLAETGQWFVAIDEVAVGTRTRFVPVAYAPPAWKAVRTGLRPYVVDTRDEETEEKTRLEAEKNRLAADALFASRSVVEAGFIAGGLTGRYRIAELGVVVYMSEEQDQLLARTGDVSVMKKLALVPKLSKLLPHRCKGMTSAKILHVTAKPDWKAAAVYVEVACLAEGEQAAQVRVRKLVVSGLEKIL